MKRILPLVVVSLCTIYTVKAQTTDTAKAIIHYKFSHLRDTTDRNKPYNENMILFLGKTSSAYKSYDRKMQDALVKKQIADQIAAQKGSGSLSIKVTNNSQATSTEYYSFPLQNKFVRKEKLITSYLIEEPMPVISWKISSDTASFGTLHCQKATAYFKGRNYTAWFCPDVPLHTGPWKLNGLPGLIVEAYDAKKEVVFKFDGMEEVKATNSVVNKADAPTVITPGGATVKMFGMDDSDTDPNVIALPVDAVKTTEKEFTNLKEAMRKDPQAFMQSAMAGSGMAMRPPGAMSESGAPNRTMKF